MKTYDIVVIGGSIGGVLASISAAKLKQKVCLVEQTKWIGGQFTSQAVPPDEHPFIESFGCTDTYRKFRDRVRSYMKENFKVKPHIKDVNFWNPGHASVSRLSAPPQVYLDIFMEMITPYIKMGYIDLKLNTKVVSADSDEHMINHVVLKDLITQEKIEVKGTYYLDATDTSELLPITRTEYVVGAESKHDTQEPHALEQSNPKDMQPITWVAAVSYDKDQNHVIEKPELYDMFKSKKWPCDDQEMLSWYGPDASTGVTKKFQMFDGDEKGLFALWSYRRIIDPRDFEDGVFPNEATLINWPQNDYIFNNIFDTNNDEQYIYESKQLTLSLIYWLQTEAPRPDGSKGYPGIQLRGDLVGSSDGLALAPYIRESRRIKALHTITEHAMNAELIHELPSIDDSVGVGSYHIDLHMTTVNHRFFFFKTWPFQIPLGAMIPVMKDNLLPACKNIGTTQLTNGCFRLHPVEWNIGEVSGYLAALAIKWHVKPRDIYLNKELLKKFQKFLDDRGIERQWPKDLVHVI
jgi:hypothetical protein